MMNDKYKRLISIKFLFATRIIVVVHLDRVAKAMMLFEPQALASLTGHTRGTASKSPFSRRL